MKFSYRNKALLAFSATALTAVIALDRADSLNNANGEITEKDPLQGQTQLFAQVLEKVLNNSVEKHSARALTEVAIDAMIKIADPQAAFSTNQTPENDASIPKKLQLNNQIKTFSYILKQANDLAEKNKVPGVTYESLTEAGLKAMLQSLDPHSSYATQDEWILRQQEMQGKFGGIGVSIGEDEDSGFIKALDVMEGTPAARAGVKKGDLITHVEEMSMKGVSLKNAVDRLRGESGTSVEITIQRDGESSSKKFNIEREVIKTNPVKSRLVETDKGRIGYIKIVQFGADTDNKVDDAIRAFENSEYDAPSAYIVDVRNNPGGYLHEVANVADNFLESGDIVWTKGRDGRMTEMPRLAKRGDEINGKPLVILTNRLSASASEILASTLKFKRSYLGGKGRATVIGEDETTYGKGSVQSSYAYPPFGGIYLTIALYYAPEQSPQNTGVTPDIKVIMPPPTDEEIKIQEQKFKKRLERLTPEDRKKAEEDRKIKKDRTDTAPESRQKGTLKNKGELTGEMNLASKICEMQPAAAVQPSTSKGLLHETTIDGVEKIDVALACAVEYLQGTSALTAIKDRPPASANTQKAPAPSS